jgi:Polysulphide reductase, NrfD
MVPRATFTSYYGRPVVKPSPWEADIPLYFFLGGLAGASSMLAAGAGLTGRPALRRATRIGALGSISAGFVALVHDLGRPSRFVNMLRVAKPTSPMSVGTWMLTAYGPLAGLAAAGEMTALLPGPARSLARPIRLLSGPAGMGAAVLGAGVASYTAVLLSDTATPTWHEARRELPFVFVGSAAGAAGGLGMLGAPVDQAGPARRLAVGGAIVELLAERRMETSMGVVAEPLRADRAGRLLQASRVLTCAGALGALLAGRHSRAAAGLCGAALLAGSAAARFGFFEAGQQSARDPRYTVVPQRERLEQRERTAGSPPTGT